MADLKAQVEELLAMCGEATSGPYSCMLPESRIIDDVYVRAPSPDGAKVVAVFASRGRSANIANAECAAALLTNFPSIARHYLELLAENIRYKETVAVLENTETVKALVAGINDMQEGRTIDLDKLDLLEACEAKNAALLAENERLRADTWCDVCCGTGKAASDKPCLCGGTGRSADALVEMRRLYFAEEADNEQLFGLLKRASKYLTEVDTREFRLDDHQQLQQAQADCFAALARADALTGEKP